jgi:alpha-L-fucosidase
MFEINDQSPPLADRLLPTWYADAKFGIFLHLGPYLVPSFAPVPSQGRNIQEVIANDGWQAMLRANPYAEWYQNSLRIADSPVRRYHEAHFPGLDYADFAKTFRAASAQWQPDQWAKLFAAAGARYVIPTTKHHDGYALWPSEASRSYGRWSSERNLVGDIAAAVRAEGLRFGAYYSGGLDWTFEDRPIADFPDFGGTVPQSTDYAALVDAHFDELIDRYRPDVLWNDIAIPSAVDTESLFERYYAACPEGVVNDRFEKITPGWPETKNQHYADYDTVEYLAVDDIRQRKWETTRGFGVSFAHNAAEPVETLLTGDQLIATLADVAAKNGNLLLNVAVRLDGSIRPEEESALRTLGRWLDGNGSAIFATRPWRQPQDLTHVQNVRFTAGADGVNAILIGAAPGSEVHLPADIVDEGRDTPRLLTSGELVAYRLIDNAVVIRLPDNLASSPAHVLRFSGARN